MDSTINKISRASVTVIFITFHNFPTFLFLPSPSFLTQSPLSPCWITLVSWVDCFLWLFWAFLLPPHHHRSPDHLWDWRLLPRLPLLHLQSLEEKNRITKSIPLLYSPGPRFESLMTQPIILFWKFQDISPCYFSSDRWLFLIPSRTKWHIRAAPISVSLTLGHTAANCSESYSRGASLLVAPHVSFPTPFLGAERLARRQ